jgi:hypothetical protein
MLQRRLSSISQAHQVARHETPTGSSAVRLVWAGIRRTHGVAQQGKSPTLIEDLRLMVSAMAPQRRGQAWRLLELRDRALLLLGFAGLLSQRACRAERRGPGVLAGRPGSCT